MKQIFAILPLFAALAAALPASSPRGGFGDIFEANCPFERMEYPESFTLDFMTWLRTSRFSSYVPAFERYVGFGGKSSAGEAVTRQPVVFIHGSTEDAATWGNIVNYFKSRGYGRHELYGVTWGLPKSDGGSFSSNKYECQDVKNVRAFIMAVNEYTGSKVDVIAYSMGVPTSRQALKGGNAGGLGSCSMLGPLTSRVDTFVGLAGPNRGVPWCQVGAVPSCSSTNGHYRGATCSLSEYLSTLQANGAREADYVYSIYAEGDEAIGHEACGVRTAAIPGEDGTSLTYWNHSGVLTCSGPTAYLMAVHHQT